jgi:putative endonuclease
MLRVRVPSATPRVRRGSPKKESRFPEFARYTRFLYNIRDMSETSDVSHFRFYVYILYCYKDRGFYIGFTNNLKRRITEHASGQVESTKNRLPVKLIHYEYFITESDALAREKFLKSGYGRKQFGEILKNTLTEIGDRMICI